MHFYFLLFFLLLRLTGRLSHVVVPSLLAPFFVALVAGRMERPGEYEKRGSDTGRKDADRRRVDEEVNTLLLRNIVRLEGSADGGWTELSVHPTRRRQGIA